MGKISIIPDRQNMDCSIALAKEYNAAFEYNDFWKPDVLENRKKQEGLYGIAHSIVPRKE